MIQLLTIFLVVAAGLTRADSAAALTIDSRTTLWTARNSTVPVCFSNGMREWPEVKKRIISALKDTWEFHTNVTFVNFDACDPANGQERVRILVKQNSKYSWGGQTHGKGLEVLRSGALPECDTAANVENCRWSMSFLVPKNFNEADLPRQQSMLRFVAVHEFGHVLGFVHEQDTDRNFTFIRERVGQHVKMLPDKEIYCRPAVKTNYLHYRVVTNGFDLRSVMVQSYCQNGARTSPTAPWGLGAIARTGKLTASDIAGARMIYGRRRNVVRQRNP